MSRKMNMLLPIAQNIAGAHSTPDRLGRRFDIAQPKQGVAYHYFQDDDTIDPFFGNLKKTHGGPVLLAQDLTCINVAPEQIVMRQGPSSPGMFPRIRSSWGIRPE